MADVVCDGVGGGVCITVLTIVCGVIMVLARVVVCVVTFVGICVFGGVIVVAAEISGFVPWLSSGDFLLIVFPSIM